MGSGVGSESAFLASSQVIQQIHGTYFDRKARERKRKAIDMLEKENADCIVVTHACFANTFTKQLKKRGYKIDKRKFRMNNLERVTAYK